MRTVKLIKRQIILISTPSYRGVFYHKIQILRRYSNEKLMVFLNLVLVGLEGSKIVSVTTQNFVLYDNIHLCNTVLKLEYLAFYKFNRPYIQFNLIKFF